MKRFANLWKKSHLNLLMAKMQAKFGLRMNGLDSVSLYKRIFLSLILIHETRQVAWDVTANFSFGRHYGFIDQEKDVDNLITDSTDGLLYFAPVRH